VLWLHEEWGREEIFYHRRVGSRKKWTDEEKKIITDHYISMSRTELMVLLPDKTWATSPQVCCLPYASLSRLWPAGCLA
ncbi:MAG TPA: hypothetical protein VH164_04100, partial [Ktedonobacteraceae bacterium]|nr:hypothetical protein [Ktedonobacteraceae bacterium]